MIIKHMFYNFKIFIWAFFYYLYNNFITHVPIYFVRKLYLKFVLRIKIGENTSIAMHCFFSGGNIEIGDNCVINRNCYFDGRYKIIIHNNVSISPECYLITFSHEVNDPNFSTFGKKIELENYVWLGARSIIMPGITLDKGVIVGAGSVVTKSFDKFSIIGGVPAKMISKRHENLQYKLNYFPLFDSDIIFS